VRILIVEDTIELAGLIASGLRRSGFCVDAVGQGEDAIFAWRAALTTQSSLISAFPTKTDYPCCITRGGPVARRPFSY
jgi:hypothetical protein